MRGKDEGESLYVVSHDSDFQEACSQNGPLYDPHKLIDFLNDLQVDLEEARQAFVLSQMLKRKDKIVKDIMRNFPDRGFVITDVEDWDAEVQEVRVTEVEIEDDAFEVVDISDGQATVFVTATVNYEADLCYGDVDNAPWDGEDQRYIFIQKIAETVQRDGSFDVEITVSFDDLDPESFEIDSVSVDAPSTVKIETDRNAGWPYK